MIIAASIAIYKATVAPCACPSDPARKVHLAAAETHGEIQLR
jgi:hypothetical protein